MNIVAVTEPFYDEGCDSDGPVLRHVDKLNLPVMWRLRSVASRFFFFVNSGLFSSGSGLKLPLPFVKLEFASSGTIRLLLFFLLAINGSCHQVYRLFSLLNHTENRIRLLATTKFSV